MSIKPILFNTDMVRAILNGCKTVTRRVVKFREGRSPNWTGYVPDGPVLYGSNNIPAAKAPYRLGDILYVRETWAPWSRAEGIAPTIHYKADGESLPNVKWRPSIHMPREAARIWLRVTDVRVERLHEIDAKGIAAEGIRHSIYNHLHDDWKAMDRKTFLELWDSTIKPADRDRYGWAANPFCWVISFERISKDETMQ